MNNENNNEVLSCEELENINEKLKRNENMTLPEGLEPENMASKLENVKQFIPESETDNEGKKKHVRKKIFLRTLAAAAAFIIAVTSVMLIKPWEKEPVKPVLGNTGDATIQTNADDYAEIEAMFAQYSENYKSYHYKDKYTDMFGNLLGSKAEDALADGDAIVQYNSSVTGSVAQTPGVTSPSAQENTSSDNKNTQHGETNEQVKGVSEADIIKNDGTYLYVVNPDNADWGTYYDALYSNLEKTTVAEIEQGQSTPPYNPDENDENVSQTEKKELEMTSTGLPKLRYDCSISIISPEADGSMDKCVKLKIAEPEDESIFHMSIKEMYVKGNNLIALLNCQKYGDDISTEKAYYAYNRDDITMAVCFDISNRSEPVESWRVYQDGMYLSSRLVGNQLVMISDYYVDISEDAEVVKENCIPTYGTTAAELQRVPCDCICIMENVYDSCYLVASTLDIGDKETLKTTAVLGAGEDVYCTTENLYATSTEYKTQTGVEEIFNVTTTDTQIYKFDIRNSDIKFVGKGSVKGRALNQFSIDEYNGYLRIATTTGDWGESLVNQLYVLDNSLKVVGSVEGIAKGETIKSVRFTGDTGYVVTFEQTDPLFVIDLSNPEKPEIKGELKIPGFSTYLHPVSESLVLGVGVDGDENGQNNGMKVSLFDVSNPEKPVECDKVTINAVNSDYRWSYVESDAFFTHKALCWDAVSKTMYIPYGKSEQTWASYDGSQMLSKQYAGILAVVVDEESKALVSTSDYISNSTDYETADSFSRVTYIENIIFGYSQNESIITSFDKNTQKLLCSTEL